MKFNKKTFSDFAKLCTISYQESDIIKEHFLARPFNKTDYYSVFYNCNKIPKLYAKGNDSEMYTCDYDNKLSIIFRGTESMRDVLTDLNIIQVDMNLENFYDETPPEVHWGFYNQFKELKPDLDKIINDYKSDDENKEIVFAGHSLGGALATIASVNYSYNNPNLSVNCITYGSPRVGDQQFADIFNKNVKNSFRFVNDNDPIPCIPTSWRFRHVKGCQWLYQDQVMNEIKVWRGWRFFKNYLLSFVGYGYDSSKDHSCDNYCKDMDIIPENFNDSETL